MSGPHIHHIDPIGGRHQTGPPRSTIVLPLLIIFCLTCLIFSEIEYLLPISRIMNTSDEIFPTKKSNYQDFWLIKDLKPLQGTKQTFVKNSVSDESFVESEQDASDEQPEQQKTPIINRIVLLGERHSGTSFTTRVLSECFPDLDVSDFFVRYKHWFQPTPDHVVNVTRTYLQNGNVRQDEDMHKIMEYWPKLAAMENPKTAFNKTLVIVMFRNAYDWLEAMRVGPHHWSNHFEMYRFPNAPVPDTIDDPFYGSHFLPWKDFLAANMTIGTTSASINGLCQNAYSAKEVSPCQVSKQFYPRQVQKDYNFDLSAMPDKLPFNAHNPIYELNENGKPFENPLELRTAKMRNLLDIPNNWDVGSFMTLQHEDVNSKGSRFLLEQVSKMTGMEPKCEPDPPRNQEMKIINGDWQNWITEHADWELEGRIGYQRRPLGVVPGEKKPDEEKEVGGTDKHEQHEATSKVTRPSQKSRLRASQPATSLTFDRIVLLGERHSGTSYTTRMLAKCFPGLDVSDFLVRYKHWFQPTPEYVVNVTKTFLQMPLKDEKDDTVQNDEDMHKIAKYWPQLASLENPKSAFHKTLVIVMFRNVYDWLEAMRLGPHHWNNHFIMYRFENAPVPDTEDNPWYGSNFLPWKQFLEANMTIGNGNGYNSNHLCQNAYRFGSISPCRVSKEMYPNEVKKDYGSDLSAAPDNLPFNGHRPIYELDENGKPFGNPLELRTAKIRNFMNIPNTWDVGGFMTLQHEDINSKGSGFLLEQVSKIVGIPPSCEPDPPRSQERKQLDEDWTEWITANADWEAEGLLGYEKRPAKSVA